VDDAPPLPGPRLSTAGRFVRNVAFSVAAQAWALVLALITIRIVVRGLGPDAYGVYVIASLVLGYVAFLDLGLTAALVRSIAIHRLHDPRRLEAIVGTGFAALLVLGLLGGAALALLTPWVVSSLLHIPPALRPDARFTFYLASLAFFLNMCLVVFAAIPQGVQRLDLLSVRSLVLTTLSALGQVTAIALGGGLRWVAIASFSSNVASLAVFGWLAPRLLPGVSFRPRLELDSLRELLGFGARRFLSQAASQAIFQFDRVIVGAFLPIRAVTSYSVPLSITQRFIVFHGSLTNAYFPAASELHGLGDVAAGRRLYLATLKLNGVIMLMLVALVAGLAQPILEAWLGPDFAHSSAAILVVLAFGYGLTTMVGISAHLADASGHPGWTAAMITISAGLNVAVSLILVPRIGAIGAAWALLIQNAICGVSYWWLVQRRLLDLRMRTALTQLWRPALAALLVGASARLIASHLHGIPTVLLVLLGGAALYLSLTLLFRVWDPRERQLALQTLRSLRASLSGAGRAASV